MLKYWTVHVYARLFQRVGLGPACTQPSWQVLACSRRVWRRLANSKMMFQVSKLIRSILCMPNAQYAKLWYRVISKGHQHHLLWHQTCQHLKNVHGELLWSRRLNASMPRFINTFKIRLTSFRYFFYYCAMVKLFSSDWQNVTLLYPVNTVIKMSHIVLLKKHITW